MGQKAPRDLFDELQLILAVVERSEESLQLLVYLQYQRNIRGDLYDAKQKSFLERGEHICTSTLVWDLHLQFLMKHSTVQRDVGR